MSARACGCDDACGWICKFHQQELEAMTSDGLQRFKARLAAEKQMKETTPTEQFRLDAVADTRAMASRITASLNGPETIYHLLNRIAVLEADLAREQRRNGSRSHDYRYLLEMERHDKERFRERIADVLTTFYHAPLSLSSVQPLLALACELNPDLVERAR
jgi:hypothetical protein